MKIRNSCLLRNFALGTQHSQAGNALPAENRPVCNEDGAPIYGGSNTRFATLYRYRGTVAAMLIFAASVVQANPVMVVLYDLALANYNTEGNITPPGEIRIDNGNGGLSWSAATDALGGVHMSNSAPFRMYFAGANSATFGTATTTIPTPVGMTITLDWSTGIVGAPVDLGLQVQFDGFTETVTNAGMGTSISFVATNSSEALVLSLSTPLPNNPNEDIYFDTLTITQIPEPSRALPLVIGVAVIGLRRRRS